jgi:hypothetical protein
LAIVIAWALSMSFTMHLPQASAASTDGPPGMAQHSGGCHDQPEPSVPAAAKFAACCVVCCNIPATAFAESRAVAFADQPFATDAPSRPAGHDIHPDPHPPRA